jgi:urease accessory protein
VILAHLMNTGLGPFYDGLLHPFVTPEDLLPVIALTLFAGLRGPAYGKTVLLTLPVAWFAGSVVGAAIGTALAIPALAAGVTVFFGALAAANRPLPIRVVAGLAIALGVLNGSLNGIEMAGARGGSLAAVGVASALFVFVAILGGHIASMRAEWARMAARVAGSWIVAIGLLMFGWSMRGV